MQNIHTTDVFKEAADLAIAREFGETLNTSYPGWLWAIEVPDHNVVVRLLNGPAPGMGFFIPRTKLGTPDTNKKLAVWAGGEWLERCGWPRGPRPDSVGGEAVRMEGAALKLYRDAASKHKARLAGDQ